MHVNILVKKPGRFEFLDKNYNFCSYSDFDDIPDPSNFSELLCFLPDIPPSPHSVQDHELIDSWKGIFTHFMEIIYASRNKNR